MKIAAEAAVSDAELDIFEAAALGHHPRLAELLRRHESVALAWSDDGFTAAAAGQHPFDHVGVLIARGADIDGRQASGHTALDAKLNQDQPLIDLLITKGATE